MGYPILLSQTAAPLLFFMVDSADHISGKTGLTPAVTLSKSGGSFASPSGAVTEIANGWYKVAGNATDSGTLGPLVLNATGSGADVCVEQFMVVAYDNRDAAKLGLTYLDAAISTRSTYAGGDTSGTTTLLSRLTPTRAGLLDFLDAAISSRSTYAGGDTAGTTTLLSRLTNARAGYLDTLNGLVAAIWSAVSDSAGVTTLLSRLSNTRATGLDNLDVAVSSRNATSPDNAGIAAIKAKTDLIPSSPAAIGSAMTLTTGERTAIANEVEAQIIDDTDSEKVLQAIVDKIAAVNPSLDDLTLGGIASAVRSELEIELARIDAATSTRLAASSYTEPNNAGILAAIAALHNLGTSDLNTLRDALRGGGWTDETLVTLQNTIEIVTDLISAGAFTAPALANTPTGTVELDDETQALIEDIHTRTATLGGAVITVTSPVTTRGTATVVQGADYSIADGTHLPFSILNPIIEAVADNIDEVHFVVDKTRLLDVTCEFSTISGGIRVDVELTAEQTRSLDVNAQNTSNEYTMFIEIVLESGHIIPTPLRGPLTVQQGIDEEA